MEKGQKSYTKCESHYVDDVFCEYCAMTRIMQNNALLRQASI